MFHHLRFIKELHASKEFSSNKRSVAFKADFPVVRVEEYQHAYLIDISVEIPWLAAVDWLRQYDTSLGLLTT